MVTAVVVFSRLIRNAEDQCEDAWIVIAAIIEA
jgi:hypothetical protein